MPTIVPTAGVEIAQVREQLAIDRRAAGEARRTQRLAPLTTATYSMPLRVRARRRWRSDRRLRVVSVCSCLAATMAIVLGQLPLWESHTLLASESPAPKKAAQLERAGAAALRSAVPAPLALARLPGEQAPRQPDGFPSRSPVELSPQRRLQRADLWLTVGTTRGAHEARSLLESAVTELPRSAHGQAALADACLRLNDESCARAAITQAMQLRPWRAGYRVLSRKIDAAFATRHSSR